MQFSKKLANAASCWKWVNWDQDSYFICGRVVRLEAWLMVGNQWRTWAAHTRDRAILKLDDVINCRVHRWAANYTYQSPSLIQYETENHRQLLKTNECKRIRTADIWCGLSEHALVQKVDTYRRVICSFPGVTRKTHHCNTQRTVMEWTISASMKVTYHHVLVVQRGGFSFCRYEHAS